MKLNKQLSYKKLCFRLVLYVDSRDPLYQLKKATSTKNPYIQLKLPLLKRTVMKAI